MREVWGYQSPGRTRTLDSHACRLRRKLSSDTHRLATARQRVFHDRDRASFVRLPTVK